jgi:hypothetical protein
MSDSLQAKKYLTKNWGTLLPQAEEAVYLGIPFAENGFNSKKFAENCARKIQNAV